MVKANTYQRYFNQCCGFYPKVKTEGGFWYVECPVCHRKMKVRWLNGGQRLWKRMMLAGTMDFDVMTGRESIMRFGKKPQRFDHKPTETEKIMKAFRLKHMGN